MWPSLALRASQRLTVSTQPALSPRQQQAVRLLQLPSTDYAQLLRQAVCDNPFLEWADEGWDLAGEALAATAPGDESASADDSGSDGDGEPGVDGSVSSDLADVAWSAPSRDPSASHEEGLARLACPVTLAEHLAGQLRLLRLPARERLLCLAVAASLDDDGYLRLDLSDLAQALPALQPGPLAHEWTLALTRVQALEPSGVGARTLSECLALQLRAPGLLPARVDDASGLTSLAASGPAADAWEDPIALARTLVQDHLPALASRDLAALARRLGQPLQRVQAACERIRRLDPRPGWRIGAPAAGAIIPDVVVRRGPARAGQPGGWQAELNPAVMPRLRLQQGYADWCTGHREQAGPGLGQQLQEARWTLRNVEQRFATILAVARAILQRQHRFLALGPLALRPLALREIAQAVGVHESTVSRVTQHKYMATPCGLFELRFFFSRGLATDSGGHCSPTAVRGLIRALVAAEPREAPLSDVDLARALAAQGLQVARRTVTQYRQQLRIAPAPRRGPSIR